MDPVVGVHQDQKVVPGPVVLGEVEGSGIGHR
jgi:hypothetical protein